MSATKSDPLGSKNILACIGSAVRLTEGELRYQLAKRGDPLAHADELLDLLVQMEHQGLVRTELVVTLAKDAAR